MQFLVYQADFLPKKRFHFSTFCKNVNIFYLECTFIVNIFEMLSNLSYSYMN